MTDKRYKVGVWVSGLYVGLLCIYAFMQRCEVMAMTPNEAGDALAGAASPLAFFWLVLGYLQQGDELKQNTHALRLQAEELKNSVEQQRQMVRAAEATLIATERPILTMKAAPVGDFSKVDGGYGLSVAFTVKNVGRTHAERVFVHTRLVTLSGQDFLQQAWNHLDAFASIENNGLRPGVQVPPGESRVISWRCFLSDEEIQRGRAYSDKSPGRLPSTALLGTAMYESIMGSRHATSVAYWIFAFDRAVHRSRDLPETDVVPVADLVLEELQMGHGPTK